MVVEDEEEEEDVEPLLFFHAPTYLWEGRRVNLAKWRFMFNFNFNATREKRRGKRTINLYEGVKSWWCHLGKEVDEASPLGSSCGDDD